MREPHGTVHAYHTLALVNPGMHCTCVLTHVYTHICKHTHMGSMGHVSVHVLVEASYRHRWPAKHPSLLMCAHVLTRIAHMHTPQKC